MKTYLLLAASLLAASSLQAQGNLDAPQDDRTDESVTSRAAVVVTASRHDEPSLKVAGNISQIDEQAIQTVKAVHISEIAGRSPGTWINRGNGQEHLTAIRSPVLTGAGSCGAFVMAEDGLPLLATGFCNANQLFESHNEIARSIEIVRGPSGVFYGSNAVHGVINILTPSPALRQAARVEVEGGPHDYQRLTSVLEGGNGTQGVLLGATGTHDGGYKDSSGFDQQKVTAKHRYAKGDLDITSALAAINLNQDTAGFVEGKNAYADPDLKKTNPNPDSYRNADALRLYSRIQKTLDDSSRLVFTPYARAANMDFSMHWLSWKPVEENRQSSVGFQTALFEVPMKHYRWSSGFDFEYTQGRLTQTQDVAFANARDLVPAGKTFDYDVDSTVAALFAQIDQDLSDDTVLTLGWRFEHTAYAYDNRAEDGQVCPPDVAPADRGKCRYYRPADDDNSYHNWGLNLALAHQFDDNNAGWIGFNEGFRAPQTTELYRLQKGQAQADADSEQIKAVETGWRLDTANARVEAVAFIMRKHDVIFENTQKYVVNDSATRHQGVELAVSQRLHETLTLSGNITAASHRYTNDAIGLGTGDNWVDTAPKRMGNLQLLWQVLPSTQAELEWQHMGAYFLDPENAHSYSGHDLYNLRFSHDFDDHFNASLRLINLSDEDYAERADYAFGNYRYFVGEPRSVYLSVAYTM